MSPTLLLNIEETVFGKSSVLVCVLYLNFHPATTLKCETMIKFASKDFFQVLQPVMWSGPMGILLYCAVLCLVAQSRPILWDPLGCILPGSSVDRDSPRKNTGMGCHALLQGIFPTQGLNPGLPHCRQILYSLSHQGSPRILEWVAYPFSMGTSWCRNQTGVSCIAGGFFTSWAIWEAPLVYYYASFYASIVCS